MVDEEFHRKFIDLTEYDYPIKNPIDIYVREKETNKDIKLACYRYPVPDHIETKGVVYYSQGYIQYTGREAFVARAFAENGYEYIGFDQRGTGYSEGRRFHMESLDQLVSDTIIATDALDKYLDLKVPRFGMGFCIGAPVTAISHV